jgi:hypothetical protein
MRLGYIDGITLSIVFGASPDRTDKAELITGIEGVSSRPVRRIELRPG